MPVVIERARRGWRLAERVRIPHPPAELFPFFADARNLDQLTPPSLRFRILTPPPIEMREGARIDYRIRLRGLPVPWRTEIAEWDPPHAFTDCQLRGPYRWWVHRHRFERAGDATIMTDTVEYGVPGGPPVHALFVRRDLVAIFEYRTRRMRELFGAEPLLPASPHQAPGRPDQISAIL